MAVLRNLNVLSQMRFDVPHARLLESGVAGDFDTVVGRAMSGGYPLVVRGFVVSGGVGTAATSLQLITADSIAFNLQASESGSFLYVPASTSPDILDGATNGNVIGSWIPNEVNYVSIDFSRAADSSTSDLVVFKDVVSGSESSRLVPLGKTLTHKITISTTPFSASANLIPVARVVLDGFGLVSDIRDARNLMFRLGSGGDFPSALSYFAWPGGRAESTTDNADFFGGDKNLTNQKDWSDAIMTRLWEVGGGQNWYSPTADRNVIFTNYGSPDPSSGEYFTFNSGTNKITWQGIRFLFDGGTGISPPKKNEVEPVGAPGVDILDGQCLYVDLDRTVDRVAGVNGLVGKIADLAGLGTGVTPGSRWVIAWRIGTDLYTRDWRYPVGTLFQPATTGALGVVKLNATPEAGTALAPKVVAIGAGGGIVVTASSLGADGAVFTGDGTGAGVYGISGPTGSTGINGEGVGTASGVSGVGGADGGDGTNISGAGVVGFGGDLSGSGTGTVGVFGIGQGVGPGVRGNGGSTDAPGVYGEGGGNGNGVDGVSTGGFGVNGEAPGAGVRGSATGVGGVGVLGVSAAADAFGGQFAALGTGLSRALSATALGVGGTALEVVGKSRFTGDINTNPASVGMAYDITLGNITEYKDVALSTLQLDGGASAVPLFGFIDDMAGWFSKTTAVQDLYGGDFVLPSEATITKIEFLARNLNASTAYNIGFTLSKRTYSNSTDTGTVVYLNTTGATPINLNWPANSHLWKTLNILSNGTVPSNDSLSYGGGFSLRIVMPATAANGDVILKGIRVGYSITKFRRPA